ncbi:HAD family hydrolase [Neobacillus niacini]|jgi:Cof subfamily protein (haloacid dehalogenase superfamily)|uniref:HAD family hydrolase n=1 Tax=Neobacillus niacini TaxID=86668 RepID=UPI001C8E69A0|nr:HAD family hydrolase [Neobacillus niacini]MBY0146908.1 HAD family phosphatase [Neobacillus niacini]
MEIKPKAIFLDMDGTILNHKNLVSIHTKEIIDQLRNQGKFVFIATGRAIDEIEGLVPKGFQVDGVVTSNGMAGYVGEKAIFKHSLPLNLVEEIIKRARENEVYYELFPYGLDRITLRQDRKYVENEITEPKPESVGTNEWLSRKEAINEKIMWVDEIVGKEFSKFYFFAKSKEHINHWKKELERLKKEIDFTTSISSNHNVEVMAANVNKATGIQQMLKHFHLSDTEAMAIGDSDNDLPMLRLVHYSVAMKNAPDSIKEIVDDVTEFTCDEDGVAYYLKKRFLSEQY